MKLYYATTNPGKVELLRQNLVDCGLTLVQTALEIPEPRSSDVKEVSRAKVLHAFGQLRKPVVVLDAGFFVFSLNGFPGTYVNAALETIGVEGILRLVEGKDRTCEFRECLAFLDSGLSAPKCFCACTKGTLAHRPRGVMQKHLWSKLSLVFIPEGGTRTLAELSHQQFFEWLRMSGEKSSAALLFANWLVKSGRVDLTRP